MVKESTEKGSEKEVGSKKEEKKVEKEEPTIKQEKIQEESENKKEEESKNKDNAVNKIVLNDWNAMDDDFDEDEQWLSGDEANNYAYKQKSPERDNYEED